MKLKEIGHTFGYAVFTGAFLYDLIANNNAFGWDNAGIYAVVILGDSTLLTLARYRYGIMGSNSVEQTEVHSPDNAASLETDTGSGVQRGADSGDKARGKSKLGSKPRKRVPAGRGRAF